MISAKFSKELFEKSALTNQCSKREGNDDGCPELSDLEEEFLEAVLEASGSDV